MNKCTLVGNLVRDPETTTTANGVTLCRFSIAVNRTFANANGEREADFLNIVTWRGLAENCGKYLSKGSKVAVAGSIQTRSYDDKEGNKRTATDIVADDVEFLSPRNSGETSGTSSTEKSAPKEKAAKTAELKPVGDEDLPF